MKLANLKKKVAGDHEKELHIVLKVSQLIVCEFLYRFSEETRF